MALSVFDLRTFAATHVPHSYSWLGAAPRPVAVALLADLARLRLEPPSSSLDEECFFASPFAAAKVTGNERGGFRASSDGDDLTAGSTELILYGNTYCFQNYARANGWTWQSNYLGVRGFECWLNKSADHDDVAAYLIDTFEIDDLFIAECTSDIAAKLM